MALKDVPKSLTDASLTAERVGYLQAMRRSAPSGEAQPTTWVGKALRTGEWILGGVSDLFNRNITLPIAQSLTSDDEMAQYRLSKLRESPTPVYGGEVLRAAGALRNRPDDPWYSKATGAVLRFGADVALDPLTYVPFGALTKAGRANKMLVAAVKEGHVIEEGSKAWKLISEVHGEDLLRGTNKQIKAAEEALSKHVSELTELPEATKATIGAQERQAQEEAALGRLPYFQWGKHRVWVNSKAHKSLIEKLGYDPLIGNSAKDIKPRELKFLLPGPSKIPGFKFDVPFHLPDEAKAELQSLLSDVQKYSNPELIASKEFELNELRKTTQELAQEGRSLREQFKLAQRDLRSKYQFWITKAKAELGTIYGKNWRAIDSVILKHPQNLAFAEEEKKLAASFAEQMKALNEKLIAHQKTIRPLEADFQALKAKIASATVDAKEGFSRTEYEVMEKAGKLLLRAKEAGEEIPKLSSSEVKTLKMIRSKLEKHRAELIKMHPDMELGQAHLVNESLEKYLFRKAELLRKNPLQLEHIDKRIEDLWKNLAQQMKDLGIPADYFPTTKYTTAEEWETLFKLVAKEAKGTPLLPKEISVSPEYQKLLATIFKQNHPELIFDIPSVKGVLDELRTLRQVRIKKVGYDEARKVGVNYLKKVEGDLAKFTKRSEALASVKKTLTPEQAALVDAVHAGDLKAPEVQKKLQEFLQEEINKVIKEKIPDIYNLPLHEQIKLGQRTLAQFELGPIEVAIPLIGKGIVAENVARAFSAINRIGLVSRIEKSFRHAFSVSTESKDFDRLLNTFKNLALHRATGEIEKGVSLTKQSEALAKELGISVEKLNYEISKIVEDATAGAPVRSIKAVVGPLMDTTIRGTTKAKEAFEKAMNPALDRKALNIAPPSPEEIEVSASEAGLILSSEAAGELRLGVIIRDLTDRIKANSEKLKEATLAGNKETEAQLKETLSKDIEELSKHRIKQDQISLQAILERNESIRASAAKYATTDLEPLNQTLAEKLVREPITRPDISPISSDLLSSTKASRLSNWEANLDDIDWYSDIRTPEEAHRLNLIIEQRLADLEHVNKHGLAPISRLRRRLRKVLPAGENSLFHDYLKVFFENVEEVKHPSNSKLYQQVHEAYLSELNKLKQYKLPIGLKEKVIQASSEGKLSQWIWEETEKLKMFKEEIKQWDPLYEPESKVKEATFSETVAKSNVTALEVNIRQHKERGHVPPDLYKKLERAKGLAARASVVASEAKLRYNQGLEKIDERLVSKYRAYASAYNPNYFTHNDLAKMLAESKAKLEKLNKSAAAQIANPRSSGISPGLSQDLAKTKKKIEILEEAINDPRRPLVKIEPVVRETKGAYVPTPIKIKRGTPEPGSIWEYVHELTEAKVRNEKLAQSALGRSIPILADRLYLEEALSKEGIEMVKSYLVKEGLIQAGDSPRKILDKVINTIQSELVAVNKYEAMALLDSKNIQYREGGVSLKRLQDLLKRKKITDTEYQSVIRTLGPKEVNEFNAAGRFKWSPKTGGEVPSLLNNDVVQSSVIRGVRTQQALTAKEFYQHLVNSGVGREVSTIVDEARELLPEYKGWRKVPIAELNGIAFPPEVAKALTRWNEINSGDPVINEFLRKYDAVQDAWKAWTLAIFPAYHSRNFVGNLWNNWLAGITNPKYYVYASRLQRGEAFHITDVFGRRWTSAEFVDEMRKLGVMDKGQFGADILRTLETQLKSGKPGQWGRENWVVKQGFKVGQAIENNARVTHFIAKIAEGYTPQEAAMSVKKYLFDYSELTEFEKNVMKRLFPFYAWTRKNIPLQLEHLVTNPAKFSVIYKGRKAIEDDEQKPKEKFLPQWVIENFPTRIRYNEKKKSYEYFLAKSWLPAMDLVKLLEIHETAAGMLAPIPKEVIQQMFNYDLYTKRKIESIPGEKTRLNIGPYTLDAPSRVVHGAKLVRLLNEVDKLSKPEKENVGRFVEMFVGNTYTYDERKEKKSYQFQKRERMTELSRALKSQRNKKPRNDKEIKRILGLIKELRHE